MSNELLLNLCQALRKFRDPEWSRGMLENERKAQEHTRRMTVLRKEARDSHLKVRLARQSSRLCPASMPV